MIDGVGMDVTQDFEQAFLVISATARTAPDYPDRGYAGPSGRLDVIARSLLASTLVRNTLFTALLLGPPDPPVTLLAHSNTCRLYSERMVMVEIKRAFRNKSSCIQLFREGPEALVYKLAKTGAEIVILKEEGRDISKLREALHGKKAYVLGAHVDIPPDVERLISKYARYEVSIGPRSVYTSHAILYVLWARSAIVNDPAPS